MKEDPTKVARKSLKSKSYKKKLSRELAMSLAVNSGSEVLKKAYWNTYYCHSVIDVSNGIKRVGYCKNRWCLVCQSIKMAHMANGYRTQLEKFEDPMFVTLTAPTVLDWQLKSNINLFLHVWRSIMKTAQKEKREWKGLRKCECTIRPLGYYHFHFHIIVDGRDNAQWLVEKWLERMPNTDAKGQDISEVRKDVPIIEMFKYFTKLTTTVEAKKGERILMPAKRLNVIFEALQGMRVFQPFGQLKRASENVNYSTSLNSLQIEDGIYSWHDNTWWDMITGVQIEDAIISATDNTNTI